MAGTTSEFSVRQGMYGYVFQESFHQSGMVYIPLELVELRERVYEEVAAFIAEKDGVPRCTEGAL